MGIDCMEAIYGLMGWKGFHLSSGSVHAGYCIYMYIPMHVVPMHEAMN